MRSRLLAAAGVATVALGAMVGTAAPATAQSGDLPDHPAAGCQAIHQSGTSHITAQGASTSDESSATKYRFSSGGTTLTEVVPPKGWSPLTASNTELRAYGFHPRPTDAQRLAAWKKQHAKYRSVTHPRFCMTHQSNPPSAQPSVTANLPSESPSSNWSGLIAETGNYNEVEGEWTEPSFQAVCSSASSYSIWPGIGGFNGGSNFKLIQAGTDVDASGGSVNTMYTWVELISGQHLFPELETNAPVSPGDTMAVYVWWDSANNQADFEFDNVTQGWDGAVGVSSVNGVPASDFYDPSTAEVIAERATNSNTQKLYNLRKPSSGSTSFYGMEVNGETVYHDSNLYSITMMDSGYAHNLSTVDNYYTDPTGGTEYWNTTWHACN